MTYPHLVVAVICTKGNKILMVNEIDNGISCWNQPAGHVEVGESIQTAAIREALEETGYKVELTGIQGIYQGIHLQTGTHYVRICFQATAVKKIAQNLDPDIIKADWLDIEQLLEGKYPLRSELTRITLEELTKEPILPLSLIHEFSPGATK